MQPWSKQLAVELKLIIKWNSGINIDLFWTKKKALTKSKLIHYQCLNGSNKVCLFKLHCIAFFP